MKKHSKSKENEYELFARLLRQNRENSGVTQVEMAKAIGQTQPWVSRHENGDLRLDFIQVRNYLNVINVSLTKFAAEFEKAVKRR